MQIPDQLKPREIEIIRLMADGLTNREISEQLYIGVETVRWYAKQIYSKLDVSGREEAADKAHELGLLDDNQTTPTPHPLSRPKHNLPTQMTSFIGREAQIEAIKNLLKDTRLLTLTGPGGTGKTRLSIRVAEDLLDEFDDGVYFVDLAPITNSDAIPATIGAVLGATDHVNEATIKSIKQTIGDRYLLLVIDNYEHVIDGASMVSDLLMGTEHLKVLVTSREALRLSGEQEFSVPPLNFNENNSEAVTLFVQRAQMILPSFKLDSGNLEDIVTICQRVDGLPLAIELATGWLKTLSPHDILQQIQHNIDILLSRSRDIPDRHRSIRAVFDHSLQMLKPHEQKVFSCLSVFRDGFTREAAEEVANADLLTLSVLIEKSMIRRSANDRYGIHELMRQYGENLLEKAGHIDSVNVAHMNYYATFASSHVHHLKTEQQIEVHQTLKHDTANLVKAWQSAIHYVNYDTIDAMTEVLSINYQISKQQYSMESLIDDAIQKLQAPKKESNQKVLNRLIAWKSYFVEVGNYFYSLYRNIHDQPQYSPLEQINQCLQTAQDQQDIITQILCHLAKGIRKDTELSLPLDLVNALELSQQIEDLWYECLCLRAILRHYFFTRRIENDEGDRYLQYYVDTALSTRNPAHICDAYGYLSVVQFDRGQVREAIQSNQVVCDYYQKIGSITSYSAFAQVKQGSFYLTLGNFEDARKHIDLGIQIKKQLRQTDHYGIMLLSKMEAIEGNPETGLQSLNQINYADRGGVFQFEVLSLCHIELGNLEQAQQAMLHILSTDLIYVGKRSMIDLLPHIAYVLYHKQAYKLAAQLFGLVDSHPSATTEWMQKWNTAINLRAELLSELGETAYQAAWKQGTKLELRETILELQVLLRDTEI